MKFTPDSLIEIYLNGSFTEEAQAEFDALLRKDASFAERVTNSLAERLGPPPEGLVEQVAGRLDSKVDGLWLAHKPSPWGGIFKAVGKAALVLAAAGGIYGTTRHFWVQNHQALVPDSERISPADSSGSEGGAKTLLKASQNPAPSGNRGKGKASAQSSRTLALSFKELPPASGTHLSTPSSLEGSGSPNGQVPAALNVQGPGAGPSVESVGKNPPIPPAPSQSEEGDALRVSVEMESRGKVLVTVLDPNGLTVRRLYQGVWDQGLHLLDWDGKDEAGSLVQAGNYTVTVNANGKTMSGTLTIRSDR